MHTNKEASVEAKHRVVQFTVKIFFYTSLASVVTVFPRVWGLACSLKFMFKIKLHLDCNESYSPDLF